MRKSGIFELQSDQSLGYKVKKWRIFLWSSLLAAKRYARWLWLACGRRFRKKNGFEVYMLRSRHSYSNCPFRGTVIKLQFAINVTLWPSIFPCCSGALRLSRLSKLLAFRNIRYFYKRHISEHVGLILWHVSTITVESTNETVANGHFAVISAWWWLMNYVPSHGGRAVTRSLSKQRTRVQLQVRALGRD